jgi:hypothetical protein
MPEANVTQAAMQTVRHKSAQCRLRPSDAPEDGKNLPGLVARDAIPGFRFGFSERVNGSAAHWTKFTENLMQFLPTAESRSSLLILHQYVGVSIRRHT